MAANLRSQALKKTPALLSIFPQPLPTHFSQVNMAANLRLQAIKKTPAMQASFFPGGKNEMMLLTYEKNGRGMILFHF